MQFTRRRCAGTKWGRLIVGSVIALAVWALIAAVSLRAPDIVARGGGASLFVYPHGNICAQAPFDPMRRSVTLNAWYFPARGTDLQRLVSVRPLRVVNAVATRVYVARRQAVQWLPPTDVQSVYKLPYVPSGDALMEIDIDFKIVDSRRSVGVLGAVLTYVARNRLVTSVVHPRGFVSDSHLGVGRRPLCYGIADPPWTDRFDSSGFSPAP